MSSKEKKKKKVKKKEEPLEAIVEDEKEEPINDPEASVAAANKAGEDKGKKGSKEEKTLKVPAEKGDDQAS
jgi:hypothetical protein